MTNIPAGWYNDGNGAQRYWDGAAWTEHVAPAVLAPPLASAVPAATGHHGTGANAVRRRRLWPWITAAAVVVVVALAVVTVVIVHIAGGLRNNPEQAVTDWDKAWTSADCDLYMAATTIDYRTRSETTDCDTFVADAQAYMEGFQSYRTEVTSSDVLGNSATITTTETSVATNGETFVDEWSYLVVRNGDTWAIDDAEPLAD